MTMNTTPTGRDEARSEQINKWVTKYGIHLRALTDAEVDRVAALYHAAIAVDSAEAHAEDARRTYAKLARQSRNTA